jgi:uncharacterized membrane protein
VSIEDAETAERYAAHVETIRAVGRRERSIGYVACLVGVMIVVVARFRLAGEPWLLWSGLAVIAVGWALFVYALWARIAYVRAHPFAEKT